MLIARCDVLSGQGSIATGFLTPATNSATVDVYFWNTITHFHKKIYVSFGTLPWTINYITLTVSCYKSIFWKVDRIDNNDIESLIIVTVDCVCNLAFLYNEHFSVWHRSESMKRKHDVLNMISLTMIIPCELIHCNFIQH